MSVYNGAPYLALAIQSILNQSESDFEFIIIDDGSDDDSPQILKDYASRDSRIRLLTNLRNIGLTPSLNIALNLAQGEYIARQDADDISLPIRLAEQADYLDAHHEAVLLGGNLALMDEHGNIFDYLPRSAHPAIIRFMLLFYNHLSGHGGVMFRRTACLSLGGYDEKLRYSQDYELWGRLMNQGEIHIISRVWLQHRRHKTSISAEKFTEQEAISLHISQSILARELGQAPPPQVITQLRGFWLEPFPERILPLQMHLSAYFRAYSAPHKNRLRAHISKRYQYWARSVSIRQRPLAKLLLWVLAFGWHPVQALRRLER